MSHIEASPLAEEPIAAPRQTIEHWQRQHNVAPAAHAGATRLHRWGAGRELTEAEYLTGVAAFARHPVEA